MRVVIETNKKQLKDMCYAVSLNDKDYDLNENEDAAEIVEEFITRVLEVYGP